MRGGGRGGQEGGREGDQKNKQYQRCVSGSEGQPHRKHTTWLRLETIRSDDAPCCCWVLRPNPMHPTLTHTPTPTRLNPDNVPLWPRNHDQTQPRSRPFFSSFVPSHLFTSPLSSLSLPRVTQIRGHYLGPYPPSPPWSVRRLALLSREESSAISVLLDSRLVATCPHIPVNRGLPRPNSPTATKISGEIFFFFRGLLL